MKVQGSVLKVRYVNDTNGYCVFDLNTQDGVVKVVGIFDSISVGEILEIEGEFAVSYTHLTLPTKRIV